MKAKINLLEIVSQRLGKTPEIPATIDIREVFDFMDADHEYDIDIYQLLDQQRVIAHFWGVDQVRSVRPNLSGDQAWHVLQTVEQRLNSEFGIDWDFIRDTADELYPEPEEANTNCLEGIACPKCQNTDRFKIAAKTLALVTDDGAEAIGDMDWDDDSPAECPECNHLAPLKEFRVQSPDDQMRPTRITRCDQALRIYRNGNGQDDMVDLLADALLWCEDRSVSFEDALNTARMHHSHESASE